MNEVDLGTEFRMKKLDPRSVIIGFLVAVIGFMSMGASNSTFDSITVGEIRLKNETLPIRNIQGETILGVMSGENAHGVALMNRKGGIVTLLGAEETGGGRITVFNSNNQETITLSGSITIFNKFDESVAFIGPYLEDEGLIVLSDRYGEVQWSARGKQK